MKSADVSSLRMLRLARDCIDRDYADEIGIPALAAGPATRVSTSSAPSGPPTAKPRAATGPGGGWSGPASCSARPT